MAFEPSNLPGTYYPRGVNMYVPAMAYAAEVNTNGPTRVDMGTPSALDADGILAAAVCDNTVAAGFTYLPGQFRNSIPGFNNQTGEFTDAPFGRAVTLVGSAAGVTQNVTIRGRDYLNQPIVRTLAMTGTTTLQFGFFKWIDSIFIAVGSAGSLTFDVGFSNNLMVPYKIIKVLSEEFEGVVVGTLGTLVSPNLTDPRIVSTMSSPRGAYTPQSTLNGTSRLTITALFDDSTNAAGNGGLHGIREFGG